MKDVPDKTGSLPLQVLKGNGFVNLIFNAYQPDEQTYTIEAQSFGILIDRLAALHAKDHGHDMMMFTKYEDSLPMEDDEE